MQQAGVIALIHFTDSSTVSFRMAAPYSDILFLAAVVAIAIAQIFIFRSTARGIRTAVGRGRVGLEWMWAILPAVSLVILFVWTWRTMHPAIPELPSTKITSAAVAPAVRS
jgi:heme/copper-type cytochrome/quinol oxidase subunit 2